MNNIGAVYPWLQFFGALQKKFILSERIGRTLSSDDVTQPLIVSNYKLTDRRKTNVTLVRLIHSVCKDKPNF